MSNFYLRTLEGVAHFGEVSADRKTEVRKAFDYYYKYHSDIVDPVEHFYKTFMSLTLAYSDDEIKTLYDRPDLKSEAKQAAKYFEIQRGRERAAQKAAQDASAAEEARRSYETREAEAAQAEAEAEAERDALDARKRADKERREAEAAQADAAAAQAAEEAEQIINEVETMPNQNIEIGTQVISSGHEYTVIDETPTTIVYEDESGKMYVEEKPKTNIFMWLGLGLLLWKILK